MSIVRNLAVGLLPLMLAVGLGTMVNGAMPKSW